VLPATNLSAKPGSNQVLSIPMTNLVKASNALKSMTMVTNALTNLSLKIPPAIATNVPAPVVTTNVPAPVAK
jgi:hypothetical protein